MGEDFEQTSINQKIPIFIMSKILVGRQSPKEVEVNNSLVKTAKKEDADAEKKEELAQAPVEDEQVDATEEGDADSSEEKAPTVKGRGKKRGKA